MENQKGHRMKAQGDMFLKSNFKLMGFLFQIHLFLL